MEIDLLVKNAIVVTEEGVLTGSLAVTGETIAAILPADTEAKAADIVDAKGMVLLPGAIDTHPHFFEPGPTYREDLEHGTRAAASGGFTTILDMPNTCPPVRDAYTFRLKRDAADKSSLLDFALWGSAMPGNLDEISKLHDLGCIAFKAFTIDIGTDFEYSGSYAQLEEMRRIRAFNGIYGAHAEDNDIVKNSVALSRNRPWTPELHDAAHPWYAELTSINSLLLFAKITGCKLHICHMSIPEGAELVKKARADGVDVTVETCPHYLTLNLDNVKEKGTFVMINPPVRSKDRMEKLWDYVLDGTINYMGTDHAPYLEKDKLPADGDLWNAAAGAPSIDIAIPLLLEEGVKKRGMTLQQFASFTSTNAAKRFGLYPRKGHIAPGADADFMLVDMNAPWTYTRANSFSKTKVTRFAHEGRKMECAVKATYLRGHAIYSNGIILQDPGYGKLLK